ncbi:hypothetical protein SAMN05444392_1057 [Seinonella peptonophila]|uniref:Uncharacterized protein n=1 Tax=Seinonella peptonophila TaxID=112248 RepID=A0A1M4XIH4_9BACL|nr:hypothetical protein [Seinonella peptonophila]SHE92962.1 hypothetical protein SAMN05444392_1057 [Seinonella peptonophila]
MRDRYYDLIYEAMDLPYGNSKVALLEEAVRIADAHLSSSEAYNARMDLTNAAVMSGRIEKAILSFAWCLSYYDKQENREDTHSILWHYKWICENLHDFPEIKKEKIEESLEDYRKRLLENGYGLRSYYKLQRSNALHADDIEKAAHYFELWDQAAHDGMTDCSACELDSKAYTLLRNQAFDQAYEVAKPIFAGQISCQGVPQATYASFLLPLLEQKRADEAANYYQKCREMIDYTFLYEVTCLLEYLIVVDLVKAVSWFEEFLKDAIASFVPSRRFSFYRASVLLFEQLNEQQLTSIQFPNGITPEQIRVEMYEIAERFDERNQNDHFSTGIEKKRRKLQELKGWYEKL